MIQPLKIGMQLKCINPGDSGLNYGDLIVIKGFRENSNGELRIIANDERIVGWLIPENFEILTEGTIPDYTLMGTPLPEIPIGTDYTTKISSGGEEFWQWSNSEKSRDLISYGSELINDTVFILAESKGYTGNVFYLFKLEDLIKIAERKNNKKVIGYKLISEKFRKPSMLLAPDSNYLEKKPINENNKRLGYVGVGKIPNYIPIGTATVHSLLNAGVLDLWFEKVYEDDSIEIFDSKGRSYTAARGKLIIRNGEEIPLEHLEQIMDFSLLKIGNKNRSVELESATFTIGCCDGITLDDIKKGIKSIKSLE